MKDLRYHNDVLDLWRARAERDGRGFYALLAEDMQLPRSRVRMWYERDSVPPKYWPRLIALARKRFRVSVTPTELMNAAAAEEVDAA